MTMDSRTNLPHGTKTKPSYVTAVSADLMTDTGIGTQALFGQRFDVIRSTDGASYGALYSIVPGVDRIDYIGTLPTSVISEPVFNPTHVVTAITAAIFEAADIKSRLLGALPRNAALKGSVSGEFLRVSRVGFVHLKHVRLLKTQTSRSFTDFAADMLGVPYVWGGTGHIGVDCSGLVQSALAATGLDSPRDADQQELRLGLSIDFKDRAAGDLIFWPGHVGIVVEDDYLLHANAHHMCVAIEPVSAAVSRIGKARTTKRL